VRVRKRVRAEREQLRVLKKREEVHVERAPVEGGEVSEAEIGENELFVPVTEEEVVVEKRPVVKEESICVRTLPRRRGDRRRERPQGRGGRRRLGRAPWKPRTQ
jgi:uncharacterized protein (TIGR02271 family)